MPSFCDRIKNLRIERKLTQKSIAHSIEISERTYISLENGNTKPSLDTATKLADYFEVSTDYLLGRSDDPTRH